MTIEKSRKKNIEELIISDNIETVIFILKKLFHAENVIIWFDNGEYVWSYIQEEKINIQRDLVSKIFGSKITRFIVREDDPVIFKELESMAFHSFDSKVIENILFHTLFLHDTNSIIIECANVSLTSYHFQNSYHDILNIVSLYLSQNIEMISIKELTNYYYIEQKKAYVKQRTILQNDLEQSKDYNVTIFYKPSDILSGDSYSIYQTSNGDILIYLLDAMGHGISPSLTAYTVSAIIQQKIKTNPSFNSLIDSIIDNLQYILTDEEQLTCGFFWFSHDLKQVDYVVAGMYAPLLLDNNKIIPIKSNNIPFMNFTFDYKISTIQINNFQKFFAYTDGLVEDTKDIKFDIKKMLNNDHYCNEVLGKLSTTSLDDDTTIIKFQRKKCLANT